MNTTLDQGTSLVKELIAKENEIPTHVQMVVAPPFTHLYSVCQLLKEKRIALGAQNCAAQDRGAYTGEVAAEMLASVLCRYVIIGHSERREYYGETSPILCQKIAQALQVGLTPVFCVGEHLEEREAGTHFDLIAQQLKDTVMLLNPSDFSKIVIAYEPVWAIGTGKTASADQAQEVHAFIRKTLAETFGALVAQTTILYGGSCKPSNAAELFAQNDIDGGLIGGASLQAEDFISMAKAF